MSNAAMSGAELSVVYRVDRNGVIVWCNSDWDAFARDNGGPVVAVATGRSVWDSIADAGTRDMWQRLCRAASTSGASVRVPYRCDSPLEHRRFVAELVPLSDDGFEYRHTLVGRAPRRPPADRVVAPASGPHRLCSWCLRLHVEGRWLDIDEVGTPAAWLLGAERGNVTHGVCPDCAQDLLSAFPRGRTTSD